MSDSEAFSGTQKSALMPAAALGGGLGRLSRQTPLEMLKQRKEGYEAELQKINAAIAALEANPEIERVMSLVAVALY